MRRRGDEWGLASRRGELDVPSSAAGGEAGHPAAADSYLSLHGWGKGIAWINGFNLGWCGCKHAPPPERSAVLPARDSAAVPASRPHSCVLLEGCALGLPPACELSSVRWPQVLALAGPPDDAVRTRPGAASWPQRGRAAGAGGGAWGAQCALYRRARLLRAWRHAPWHARRSARAVSQTAARALSGLGAFCGWTRRVGGGGLQGAVVILLKKTTCLSTTNMPEGVR